jgi:hypothetical protein
MREGPVALCDGNPQRSRQENGKIERGQEIQNMRLTRYKTAMDATTL